MKPKLSYLTLLAVIMFALSSCVSNKSAPKTKEETLSILNGVWRPANDNAKINMIAFLDEDGYAILERTPDGDLKPITGIWKYIDIAKAQLEKAPYPINIKVLSNTRILVNDHDVYKRDGPAPSNYHFTFHL